MHIVNGELKLKDYYTPINWDWLRKRDLDPNNTPTIFTYKGRELMAASGKECRVYLLDPKSLGGADHQTPLYKTPLFCNEEVDFQDAGSWGALSTWEDARRHALGAARRSGARRTRSSSSPIMNTPVTKEGGVAAFKVEGDGRRAAVRARPGCRATCSAASRSSSSTGWCSATAAAKRPSRHGRTSACSSTRPSAPRRATRATIYALDAQTGKELWSSGDQMQRWNHFSGITVVNGRVYLGTYDGTLYCFGLRR